MLFVLSAAVKFHAKPVSECALRSTPRLRQKAQALAAELRQLEAKDIKKQLHVNEVLARQYAESLGKFEKERPVPACCLYDTPLFRALDVSSFEYAEAEWANEHIRIYSGLYGLLRPFDEITPLSLPVSMGTKLKNSKGNFLKDYWRDPVTKELHRDLKELPIPVMINMASQQDAESIDESGLPENTTIMGVDFKTRSKDNGAEEKGEFLRWAMEQQCMTVDELLDFQGVGEEAAYRINPKLSKGNEIVFEENIGEGGDGGWKKKMAEFGGGQRAFIKEFATGKNRHKRAEVNKAMARETKQRRKAQSAIY
jgi:hypothetical protein